MALVKIPLGDDHVINLALTENGTAMDLDDANDIIVKLYQRRETILGEYSLTDGSVEIISANDGTCKINVPRSDFENVPTGKLYAQVRVEIDNIDFESGVKVSTLTDILLGELVYTV